jgi:hypothetical protein
MKSASVLVNHAVAASDVDVQPRDFSRFRGFPVVIGQRDQFSLVGESVCRVRCLVHVTCLSLSDETVRVFPDFTAWGVGAESAVSCSVECYKRFTCRAMACEVVGKNRAICRLSRTEVIEPSMLPKSLIRRLDLITLVISMWRRVVYVCVGVAHVAGWGSGVGLAEWAERRPNAGMKFFDDQ